MSTTRPRERGERSHALWPIVSYCFYMIHTMPNSILQIDGRLYGANHEGIAWTFSRNHPAGGFRAIREQTAWGVSDAGTPVGLSDGS